MADHNISLRVLYMNIGFLANQEVSPNLAMTENFRTQVIPSMNLSLQFE